ncbi:MAG: DUF3343 domain-containing protein [Bacillota bacterium]
MNRYIAAFHTHLSAMRTYRALTAAGRDAKMAPVPRALSSSCGTCVYYSGEDEALCCMDADYDYIVKVMQDGRYEPVIKAE